MFQTACMDIRTKPMKNSFEIVKYFSSMRWHEAQGDLYLNGIKQGAMRTAVGLEGQ